MSRREFTTAIKRAAFDRAAGMCELCSMPFGGKTPEYDHRLPCALGGEATLPNCMAICVPCHRAKTSTEDVPRIRKADRSKNKAIGAATSKGKIQSAGFAKAAPKDKTPTKIANGPTGLARRFGL